MDENFEQRKQEHISLSLGRKSESVESTGFHRVQLIHQALPELNFSDISLSQTLLGEKRKTPFFVSSMTGGWENSEELNLLLAQACERRFWILGMGSQRGQLMERSKDEEWRRIRKACPKLFLLGNIGLSQAISQPISDLKRYLQSSGHDHSLKPASRSYSKRRYSSIFWRNKSY